MNGADAAVFDFDGTLCRGESIVPYLRFAVREGFAPPTQFLRAACGWFRQKMHPGEVSAAKAEALSFIRGRSQEEMDACARRFFREKLVPAFFSEGLNEIRRLRAEGKTIVVLSASTDVYMRVLPEFLDVDVVLATECGVRSGAYTGVIGANCRGEEKAHRLRLWLREQAVPDDDPVYAAYGNSAHDAQMLQMAAHAFLINPDKKLRQALPEGRSLCWGSAEGK